MAVCSCTYGQDVNPQVHAPERAELKSLEIKDVKLFAWQVVHKKRKYVEVQEFRETQELYLIPSHKFDVECEVVRGSDTFAGGYFIWTTVDFLVAPVTRAYEQMDNSALGSSVGWGQMTEMRDLKAAYLLSSAKGNQTGGRKGPRPKSGTRSFSRRRCWGAMALASSRYCSCSGPLRKTNSSGGADVALVAKFSPKN
jgi:hypothetical protein